MGIREGVSNENSSLQELKKKKKKPKPKCKTKLKQKPHFESVVQRKDLCQNQCIIFEKFVM